MREASVAPPRAPGSRRSATDTKSGCALTGALIGANGKDDIFAPQGLSVMLRRQLATGKALGLPGRCDRSERATCPAYVAAMEIPVELERQVQSIFAQCPELWG